MVFLLVLGSFSSLQLMASTNNDVKTPQPGEVIHGFKLIETGKMKLVEGKTFLFEHQKSGAKLFYIQNEDKNCVFDISFRTPAYDNTGVNHILEHITCSGSNKYPLRDVVFAIANQTYSTEANAMTTNTMTTYPVASMSEEQLLKLADIYMDCVFNPVIFSEPNLFKREGWRYEKPDKNTELRRSGIVYSEMQGYEADMDYAASYNTLKSLFPNGTISNQSGGNTAYIPNLTYEQVLKTHRAYYHPSNALIVLYGDLDYTQFLKLFDQEYLSKYSKSEIKIDYKDEVPFTKTHSINYEFPVSLKTNCESAAIVNYAYAMTKISQVEDVGMDVIATYLNQAGSSLQRAFSTSGLAGDLSVSYNGSLPQPVLVFSVSGANEHQTSELKAFVDREMKALAANQFDAKIVEALIAKMEFNNSLATEDMQLGFNIAISVAQMWSISDDFSYYNQFFENIIYVKQHSKEGYLESLVKKYLVDNTHTALVATIPKAGLLEKENEKRRLALKTFEESLSEIEKAALIEETIAFNKWNSQEDDAKLIKTIQAVDAKEIEIQENPYAVSEQKMNGVRYVSVNAAVDETIYSALMFDTSLVPAEQLHFLELYTQLLGQMSTKQYTINDLSTKMTRYLNTFSTQTTTFYNKETDTNFHPILLVDWLGKASEEDEAILLVKEILLNTNMDNYKEIQSYVRQARANYKAYFNGYPLSVAKEYNAAGLYTNAVYEVYMHDLAYYNFLKEVEKLLETNPQYVTGQLHKIRDNILNRRNLIVVFAGDERGKETFMAQTKQLIENLPEKQIIPQDYSALPEIALTMGIEMDTTMNYNVLCVPFSEMESEFDGKYIPLMQVISENYLTPKLRYQNNVYTNIENVTENGITFITYMDPYIYETIEVYDKIPEFIKQYNLTQDSLNGYIASALSSYTLSSGELVGAIEAAYDYLTGYSREDTQKIIKGIKSATVSDFKAMATLFEDIAQKGSWTTVASESTLAKNRNLFDMTISLEGENKALSKMQYITKGQLISFLFGTDVYDQVVEAHIIKGDKDEVLTMEDLAIVLYDLLESEDALSGLKEKEVKITNASSLTPRGYNAVKGLVNAQIITLNKDYTFDGKERVTLARLEEVILKWYEFIKQS